MRDLSLNSNFSVQLNDRNDLATVSGRDDFEQSIVVHLTEFMHSEVIGTLDPETISTKLQLIANRVARNHDRISGIKRVDTGRHPEKENTYTIRIVYQSDEEFSTIISE